MNEKFFNNVRAGEAAGIKESTVRAYARDFDLPSFKNELGHVQYSEQMIPVFRQIRELKAQGLSHAEITANIRDVVETERQRLADLPEAQGLDLATLRDAIVQQLQGEFGQAQADIVNSVLTALRDQYGAARQELGEYKAQASLLAHQLADMQQQTRLLPEQAQSLRDAEEKARWAEAEAQRAQQQQAEALATAESQAGQLASALEKMQALERQLIELQAERGYSHQRIADLEGQVHQARQEQVRLAGRLGEAEAQIQMLTADLAEAQQALEAERKKGWFDKLTKK